MSRASKLTSDDREAINLVLEKVYKVRDLDGFAVVAMKELPPLVESEIAAFNEVDFSRRRIIAVLNSQGMQRRADEWLLTFEPIMHQNPLIEHFATTRDGPKKISDFISSKKWRQTELYRTFYHAFGGAYQMALALPLETTTVVAFAFNRDQSDFTERHRAILAQIQPHLTQAYLNAKSYSNTLTRLERRAAMLEEMSAGWIDIDPRLRIAASTKLARSNLSLFFDRYEPDDERLPDELELWTRDAIELVGQGEAIRPFVRETQAGRLIVRFWPSDDASEISLLTERFLSDTTPRQLEGLGLTARQAQVLYWISQGKSNAEIAVILKIGIRTVVFHVSRILEILEVSNRTEAAVRATNLLTARRPYIQATKGQVE